MKIIFLFFISIFSNAHAQSNPLLKKEWVNNDKFYLHFEDTTLELRMDNNMNVFHWRFHVYGDTLKIIYRRPTKDASLFGTDYFYRIAKLTADSLFLQPIEINAQNMFSNKLLMKFVDMKKNYDPTIHFQKIGFHSGYNDSSWFVQNIEIDSARNVYFKSGINYPDGEIIYTGKLSRTLFTQLVELVKKTNAQTMTSVPYYPTSDSTQQLFILSIDCNNRNTYLRVLKNGMPPCTRELTNFLYTLHDKIKLTKTTIEHKFNTEEFPEIVY